MGIFQMNRFCAQPILVRILIMMAICSYWLISFKHSTIVKEILSKCKKIWIRISEFNQWKWMKNPEITWMNYVWVNLNVINLLSGLKRQWIKLMVLARLRSSCKISMEILIHSTCMSCSSLLIISLTITKELKRKLLFKKEFNRNFLLIFPIELVMWYQKKIKMMCIQLYWIKISNYLSLIIQGFNLKLLKNHLPNQYWKTLILQSFRLNLNIHQK